MVTSTYPLEALVVLGCRVGPRGKLVGALRRRVQRAYEAYCQKLAPLVLACGGRRWDGHAEAWVMRAALLDYGIPSEALHVDLCSLTTYENARQAARLLATRGAQRVGLVTCDWHMPRAMLLFRRAGLDPHPLPSFTPPQPLPARVYRNLHEHLSGWLDALR
ncbi:MAG: YdcF family protein [Myxococcales bacterium]|nr:YdcF family protein [Polyangiaceae bacterium]MDW8249316.1 YdcF family protein [Myxococcales bacterium]